MDNSTGVIMFSFMEHLMPNSVKPKSKRTGEGGIEKTQRLTKQNPSHHPP